MHEIIRNVKYWITPVIIIWAVILFYSVEIFSMQNRKNVFFLHHSVGDSLIRDGGLRDILSEAGYDLWDHERNNEINGLRNAEGKPAGCYWIPDDNTYPNGLARIFSLDINRDNALSRILQNHEIIIFKSCFPANHLKEDNPTLDLESAKRRSISNYKRHYLNIRKTIDRYPEKKFIIVTSPPLHPNATNQFEADRAIQFVKWVKSKKYLGNRKNLFVFDYFSLLADPSTNMLKEEYQRDPKGKNSHPNSIAQTKICPIFADFIINITKFNENDNLPEVMFDNFKTPYKMLRITKPILSLSGRIKTKNGLHKIYWTNLTGKRGEFAAEESWSLKGLRIGKGVTKIIITAIDKKGLRSSGVFCAQYYTGKKREAILFDKYSDVIGKIYGANIENNKNTNGSNYIIASGKGVRMLFGMKNIDLDISDFDPETTYLEISYDQGTDKYKPRFYLAGIGSYVLNCDSMPGLEKIVIPFNKFQFVVNRLERFLIRGEWDESTKIIIESIRLVCPGKKTV